MRKKSYLPVVLCFVFVLTIAPTTVLQSSAQTALTPTILWSDPMLVNDAAVSRDGKYVVAVNYDGVYFYASDNSTAKWWYLAVPGESFASVAISENGSCLVAGNDAGRIKYFVNADQKSGLVSDPTWTSVGLGGMIERRTLDISDDGKYVALGGTGENVYYFNGSTSRSTSSESWTWRDKPSGAQIMSYVNSVDLSPDGKYLVAGGLNSTKSTIVFYKDAYNGPGSKWTNELHNGSIADVALSDDGWGAASVDNYLSSFHYWKEAKTLTNNPVPWYNGNVTFTRVDMSADGNATIAGRAVEIGPPNMPHLRFYKGFRNGDISGITSWAKLPGEVVDEVAVSDDGSIIAATTGNLTDFSPRVYFFASDGSEIGRIDLLQHSPIISMSGDGTVVAVAGPGYDSLDIIVLKPLVRPVGGEVLPANLLGISAPVLLVAVIVVVGATVVARKRIR